MDAFYEKFEYDENHDYSHDPVKMFVIACTEEVEQWLPGIDKQKLIDYFSQEKQLIKDILPEWHSYGSVESYKNGITGDTLLNENFYTALIISLSDGKVTEMIRYGDKDDKKNYFYETLKNSVKEKFDYDVDIDSLNK